SPERGEVISPNDLSISGNRLTRRRLGRALAQDFRLPASQHRRVGTERRSNDSRKLAHALQESVRKLDNFFLRRIDAERQIEPGREQAARLEAERERLRP